MNVLVAYESRHGATAGIAERIAETLTKAGLKVELTRAGRAGRMAGYDAFVIGSAAYMFHWQKEAVDLVRRNRDLLVGKPVWLFSSGPLGSEPFDEKGRDQKVTAIPKEADELRTLIGARDFRVFFGAYSRDRKPKGFAERFVALMPAARDALPVGDFRDWPEIEGWAGKIARDLLAAGAPVGAGA